MYIIESILNRFYRGITRSVLNFDAPGTAALPPGTCTDPEGSLLYIHIPFCESLCPYCSFHRYGFEERPARRYFAALRQELQLYKDLGCGFRGMYIGGGTPTILMDELLALIAFTRESFGVTEISVETNPNHLTAANLQALRQAGINRLSVGVQSFDDDLLRHMGRFEKYGSGGAIKEKLQSALGVFDTLNLDLIFNLPAQTEKSLCRDLDCIDELLPDQVTFYPLMTAPSVEAVLRSTLGPLDYRKEKLFYFRILNSMRHKYTGSTAWCFSRKKAMIDEYIINYEQYAGAGSGAFGYCNNCMYINSFSLDEYVEKIEKGEIPVTRVKRFTKREAMYYFMLMKLFGLSLDKGQFKKSFGKDIRQALPLEMLLLRLSGAVKESAASIELTDRGRYYWVMAMREFFIAVDTMRDYCRSMVQK